MVFRIKWFGNSAFLFLFVAFVVKLSSTLLVSLIIPFFFLKSTKELAFKCQESWPIEAITKNK